MTVSSPATPCSPPVGPALFEGYLVCIGASAGGLDALERFFKHCPPDTGAAFVVIQHLSPDHKSMMSNLLARHTRMPVVMVEDEMVLEANRLYLIPPGSVMRVTRSQLHLTPKNPHGLTLPIDIFFQALAEAYGKRAVGVILSGTGTDGTRGAMALNAAGGLLLAQDPDSAAFDGMPRSVIATGWVDAVLPPEKLPLRLLAHLHNQPYPPSGDVALATRTAYLHLSVQEVYAAILQLLHRMAGIDFADYKPTTLMRRIERRQQVRHTPELHQYLALLESDRSEVLTLRRELLISVTSFFRDPDTFALLADKVIDPMVAQAQTGDTVRVWVAGVATGEEAYTIGMLFIEAFEKARRWPNLKIFATDVDQQCVETAGIGQYPESAAAEIVPERLERFFVRKGDNFMVKNELRQCIVFARHNLLADPPFTKMDLVVCRNTLIYFNTAAQERALRALQYALCEGGALLLGSSESFGPVADGLHVISVKHKLFRRKGNLALPFLDRRLSGLGRPLPGGKTVPTSRQRRTPLATPSDAGVNTLMARYAPPALLVNAHHEALHLYGEVSRYFRAKEGAASLEVSRLLPDDIATVASALLYKAGRDRCSLMSDVLHVRLSQGEPVALRLSAHPVDDPSEERLTLLCFETPVEGGGPSAHLPLDVDAETADRLHLLERELAATRENLQATIEELETANEELQATNEELMASNEELQSSNEELQSVNEEMSTVNAEFQEKMLTLARINADLDSMAKAAGVATVFVDGEFHITRFSPDATQVFKLRESDLGRPLDDITHMLDYPRLMEDLGDTLRHQHTLEREVFSLDGKRMFLVRLLPYLVPSTTDRGAVATFVDVTAVHNAKRLQAIIDALPEHIAVVDPVGVIVMVNAAWRRFARVNGDPDLVNCGVGINYLRVCEAALAGDGPLAQAALNGLRDVLDGSLPGYSLEYACHSEHERRWFVMHVAPMVGSDYGAVVSHVNISAWHQREVS